MGRLKEVFGVFSQRKSLQELENNIRDAYKLLLEDDMESLTIARKVEMIYEGFERTDDS